MKRTKLLALCLRRGTCVENGRPLMHNAVASSSSLLRQSTAYPLSVCSALRSDMVVMCQRRHGSAMATVTPVTQKLKKDATAYEHLLAVLGEGMLHHSHSTASNIAELPPTPALRPFTLALLIGLVSQAPQLMVQLANSSELPANIVLFAENLAANEELKQYAAVTSAMDPLVYLFVAGLHHKKAALDNASADQKLPSTNADGTNFDQIQWQKKFSRDMDETERTCELLHELDEAIGVALDEAAKDTEDDEAVKDMLEMVADDVCSLMKRLSGNGEDTTTNHIENMESVLSRKLDEEDIVARSSNTWILDITGRAGGEEAAIFASELGETYKNYFNHIHSEWRFEDLLKNQAVSGGDDGETPEGAEDSHGSESERAGKLAVRYKITGEGVFRFMRHEMGTHRVQRVPTTEKNGKLQTSTASVYLVPILRTTGIEVNESDCDIEMVRGSGPGGQGMQSSSNCCCLKHRPSGISVKCHQSRSGAENKRIAMSMVAEQLWQKKIANSRQESAKLFTNQWSSGERSEKMRTYNFPQNRVTCHKLGKDFPLGQFVQGEAELLKLHSILNNKTQRSALNDTMKKLLSENFSSTIEQD